jgi:hypothetical protein
MQISGLSKWGLIDSDKRRTSSREFMDFDADWSVDPHTDNRLLNRIRSPHVRKRYHVMKAEGISLLLDIRSDFSRVHLRNGTLLASTNRDMQNVQRSSEDATRRRLEGP